MINEWNTTNEEITENKAEAFAGEGRGVTDENKIVPIANKNNSVEPGDAAAADIAAGNRFEGSDAQTVPDIAAGTQAGMDMQASPAVSKADTQSGTASQASSNISGMNGQEAPDISGAGAQSAAGTRYRRETSSYREAFRDDFDLNEEERPKKRFWRFRSGNDEESRDKLILSRIRDEDLMEYLALEQRRLEFLQQSREAKDKRLLAAFQLLISLAAIVALTYLLQDNPTILISILYVAGIVAALHVWKNPHDKKRDRY